MSTIVKTYYIDDPGMERICVQSTRPTEYLANPLSKGRVVTIEIDLDTGFTISRRVEWGAWYNEDQRTASIIPELPEWADTEGYD
jgi:hypothetical protein